MRLGSITSARESPRDKFSRLISSVKDETEILAKARPNPDLPRVFLVEDEQRIRDIIVPWLFRDGFDCREAADGRAAMGLLAAGTRSTCQISRNFCILLCGPGDSRSCYAAEREYANLTARPAQVLCTFPWRRTIPKLPRTRGSGNLSHG
jgi:hypothetical protein